VPKTLDLKIRLSDAGALIFDLQFGPRPVYGQVIDPNLASIPEADLSPLHEPLAS
jgi:hypothetical protein